MGHRLRVSAELILLHEIPELSEAEAQEVGRADLDAARLLERAFDVRALDLLEVLFEIEAGRGQRPFAPFV
jgi:hypothetical protein